MKIGRHIWALMLTFCVLGTLQAQYQFNTIKEIKCQGIENQGRTGTCWSFATSSFLEAELNRIHGLEVDLSEMFAVRNIYREKAQNYLLRQGVAGFSQGALAHDLLRAARTYGIMPESAYPGTYNDKHDHNEMESGMKAYLDGVLKSRPVSGTWRAVIDGMMSAYMGAVPEAFIWKGKRYTPVSFLEQYPLPFDAYLSLTSFSHHPYYQSFILEIPDNFSNGSFLNIPIDELYLATIDALKKGYSVAWDGDVSEKGFNAREGLAILPEDGVTDGSFKDPGKELTANMETRQDMFFSLETTDDHLMHLVGLAEDQHGNTYFMVKNSWGEIGPYNGILYMSESYFKLKTVSVHFHKEALSQEMAKKWGIN